MFILLLLLAVQVVYQLYATSVVTAAAYDGARLAAGAELAADPDVEAKAAAHVVELLGTYGRERVTVDVERTADDVLVRVVARNPGFLPTALRRPAGFDVVDRTVRVRIEREIAP